MSEQRLALLEQQVPAAVSSTWRMAELSGGWATCRRSAARVNAAGTVTVVDALGHVYYESGHLPGAINIPDAQIRELAGSLLPDKDAPS